MQKPSNLHALDPEVLREIRLIELKAGRLASDILQGNYLSAFKGQGLEFDEVREYVPGDDVRAIDWNVTARTGTPHIKVMREERELTVIILVDVSPSQGYGTTPKLKRAHAAEMAAILAFLAIRNNDKVGLILFSDEVEAYIPPKKGRGHIWNIIRSVMTHEGKGKTTAIKEALDFHVSLKLKHSITFILSDFWAEDYTRSLGFVAAKHEVVAVRVLDESELNPPDSGVALLEDSETGELLEIDLSNTYIKKLIQNALSAELDTLKKQFDRMGIEYVLTNTRSSPRTALLNFLRSREQRGHK